MNSSVQIIDNSGGLVGNCITVLGNKRFGTLGDRVVVSLRKMGRLSKRINKKVTVGKVYKALIVQTKKERRRYEGSTIQFSQNAIVLLNKQNQPIGSRLKQPIPQELRNSAYLKTLSLGTNLI